MTAAAILLIVVPLAFNAAFATLAARFDYPGVLREPTPEVLARFRAGGRSLVLLWWGFALTAVAMVGLVVLLSHAIDDADPALLQLATTTGVIAAIVQLLGLIRWPFLVPYLAEQPDSEVADVVFQAFNRYLGVAVGEHLGYLFTGAWTTLIGVALTQTAETPAIIGVIGIVLGPLLMLCALEFIVSAQGWKLAERLTPIAYVLWSAWLIATGVALLT